MLDTLKRFAIMLMPNCPQKTQQNRYYSVFLVILEEMVFYFCLFGDTCTCIPYTYILTHPGVLALITMVHSHDTIPRNSYVMNLALVLHIKLHLLDCIVLIM